MLFLLWMHVAEDSGRALKKDMKTLMRLDLYGNVD